MAFDENDLMDRDFLEERHNKLLEELKSMCRKLPPMYRANVSEGFVVDFANSLLDKTVFDIVKNLKDIQSMTENNLLEKRLKVESSHAVTREKMLSRHKEALENELRINPRNAQTLRARQLTEIQSMKKYHDEELNNLDTQIIRDLDQTVSDQQITLEKVGVPGFFISNKPADVKWQMLLLDFIQELSLKDGIE